MSTDETAESLVEQLVVAGEWPEPRLIAAILAKGKEAVEPLRALLRRDFEGWPGISPIDLAVNLLGEIGDPSVVPDLLDLFRRFDDEILESVEEALHRFGTPVIEPLIEIARDRSLAWYPRAIACNTAIDAAGSDPVARARVAEALREILADCVSKGAAAEEVDVQMATSLVSDLAHLADPLARDVINAAFQAEMVEPWMINEDDIQRLYREGGRKPGREPEPFLPLYERQYAQHLERERRKAEPKPVPRPLSQPSRPRPPAEEAMPNLAPVSPIRKTEWRPGRNDPCWCGSGKKYKQCHLRRDEDQTRG